MAENGTSDVKIPVIFEIQIAWMPATGQVQFRSNQPDPVVQLGMLEMAKVALIEQKISAAQGKGPQLVVPARFSS
jgi:hypothetical protein